VSRRLSRRRLLELAGVGGAVAVAGGGVALLDRRDDPSQDEVAEVVPYHGVHQAGIVTPQQEHLRFASYDLTAAGADELQSLLRTWSTAAVRLTAGAAATRGASSEYAPPADTGEAMGLPPARLTLTFGLGPGVFDDRYGLASRRPAALADLPRFQRDQLEPESSGGDLCVQACATDPQVAFHAIRNLTRLAQGSASLRWLQEGFLSPPTRGGEQTPRNLMGFRDGTANLDPSDDDLMNRNVWAAAADGPTWMADGTYLVARKIRIRIEQWDRTALGEQERFVGRSKESGAPPGGTEESDPVTTSKLDVASHIRLANPRTGAQSEAGRILRRGYNFDEGVDEIGQLAAGLFFLAYQRDPRRQFTAIQSRLAESDLLNEYLFHTGSAIFAVPPGTQAGQHIAQGLFASTA
jgi:deferrochelatase/peroxidase EfeB